VKLGFSASGSTRRTGSRTTPDRVATVQGRLPLSRRLAFGGPWPGHRVSRRTRHSPSVYVSAVGWRVFGAGPSGDGEDDAGGSALSLARSPPFLALGGSGARAALRSAGSRPWEITPSRRVPRDRTYTSETSASDGDRCRRMASARLTAMSPAFSVEAVWSRADSKLEPFGPGHRQFFGLSTPVREHVRSRRPYWFGRGKVRGYLGLGGGVMHLNPSVSDARPGLPPPVVATFALAARTRWAPASRCGPTRATGARRATRLGAIICYPGRQLRPFTTNVSRARRAPAA